MAKKETERDRLLQDMQGAGTQPKGFSGWFKNVFLYHYLKPTLLILLFALIGTFIIVDTFKDNSRDFTLTVLSDSYFADVRKQELYSVLAEELGDVNGNGKLEIDIVDQAITVGGSSVADVAQKMQAFEVTFLADPSSVLYLIHENYLNYFEPDKSYRPLADFGIESPDKYFLYANDFPAVQRFLGEGGGSDYYFAIKTCEISKRDKPEYIKYYDTALSALNAIITAP